MPILCQFSANHKKINNFQKFFGSLQKNGYVLPIYKGISERKLCTLKNEYLAGRSYTGTGDSMRRPMGAYPLLKCCIAQPANTRLDKRRKWLGVLGAFTLTLEIFHIIPGS